MPKKQPSQNQLINRKGLFLTITYFVGMIVWSIGYILADTWRLIDETVLIPLGPLYPLWEKTHGPGSIPVLIIGGSFLFFLICSTLTLINLRAVGHIAFPDDMPAKPSLLCSTYFIFLLIIAVPLAYTSSLIYSIYLDW